MAAMDGIVWEVEAWGLIREEMTMAEEILPVLRRYAVSRSAPIDHGEIKWAVDIGVGIGQARPLAKWGEPLSDGIIGRVGRRPD